MDQQPPVDIRDELGLATRRCLRVLGGNRAKECRLWQFREKSHGGMVLASTNLALSSQTLFLSINR